MGDTVTVSGPFFANPGAIIDDLLTDCQGAIGQDALNTLHLHLDQSLKNPTPYYETQLVTDRRGDNLVVTDKDIVYGPWLEGVGSRNQSTRFKGYKHWRITTQEVDNRVPEIIAGEVARAMRRLNG